MAISTLINKQDNFEVVRDQIAAILTAEVTSQMALATAAGEDPDEWKLRVFSEMSNPLEQFLNSQSDKSPIVNIRYDSSNFIEGKSDNIERQASSTTYSIDCYGFDVSKEDGAGHAPGDKAAALKVHKALRLVRNILMAAEYTYLGMRGVVWQRWPESVTVFQPELEGRAIQKVVGARISFRVLFNEFSPQFVAEELDHLAIDVIRAEDGEIVLEADYDYT